MRDAKRGTKTVKNRAAGSGGRGKRSEGKRTKSTKEYATNNDKDHIISIWDEAGGDKDGAAGEEVAIDA